jgi:hypothetical protein
MNQEQQEVIEAARAWHDIVKPQNVKWLSNLASRIYNAVEALNESEKRA